MAGRHGYPVRSFGATLVVVCVLAPARAEPNAIPADPILESPAFDPPLLQLTAPPTWLNTLLTDPTTQAPALAAGRVSDPAPLVHSPASPTPAMRSLYLALGVLQGLDVYTTRVAVRSGAREANPLMVGLTKRPAALIAVKAAATFGTVYLVERMRIRHPVAALFTMAAIDSAYAMLVVRNARVVPR